MVAEREVEPRFRCTTTLADGRTIGFAELGSPDGYPCLYFHGNFHSRLSAAGGDARARQNGVRLISIDRPGFGLSTFQVDRTLLSWPHDVVELADYLGLDRFSVLGLSGGSGYAYACALAIPERLTATVVVGGMVPADLPGFIQGMAPGVRLMQRLRSALSVAGERPTRFVFRSLIGAWIRIARFRLSRWDGELPDDLSPEDRGALLENSQEAIEAALTDPQETVRHGVESYLAEFRIYSQPWGFSLEDIRVPIDLYHGVNDRNVDASLAREVARRIPQCRATFLTGTGHNLSASQWDTVLSDVMPRVQKDDPEPSTG